MPAKILVVAVALVVGILVCRRVWHLRRRQQRLDSASATGQVPGPDDAGPGI